MLLFLILPPCTQVVYKSLPFADFSLVFFFIKKDTQMLSHICNDAQQILRHKNEDSDRQRHIHRVWHFIPGSCIKYSMSSIFVGNNKTLLDTNTRCQKHQQRWFFVQFSSVDIFFPRPISGDCHYSQGMFNRICNNESAFGKWTFFVERKRK